MVGRRHAVAVVFICVAFSLVAALVFPSLTRRQVEPLLTWDDAAVVSRGQALYLAQCAACHGAKDEGQSADIDVASPAPLAPPHDASGHTWQHPDFALIQLTKAGESSAACLVLDQNAMPRFEEALSDREVIEVLSYIKSTWPAEIRAEHDTINRLYASQNAAVREFLDLADP